MDANNFNILTTISSAALVIKVVLILLILISVYSWGVIFSKYRLIKYKMREAIRVRKLIKSISLGKTDISENLNKKSLYKKIYNFLNSNNKILFKDNIINTFIEEALHSFLYDSHLVLDKRIVSLATIGNVAPFIGLFGTVIGIINSFHAIGETASASLVVIAPGIAEALYATALGLIVAVPAVFAYNSFNAKIEVFKETENILIQDMIYYFAKLDKQKSASKSKSIKNNSVKKLIKSNEKPDNNSTKNIKNSNQSI